MSATFWPLQKAIFDLLKANVEIHNLVGDRIYDDVPPHEVFPYLVIGNDNFKDWEARDFQGFEATVQFDAYDDDHRGKQTVKMIADAIISTFKSSPLVVDGNVVVCLAFDSCNVDRGDDGLTYHSATSFEIKLQQT